MKKAKKLSHRKGEKTTDEDVHLINSVAVDTYDGRVHIEWDHATPVTPMGQLAFFIEFLKCTGLFDEWVTIPIATEDAKKSCAGMADMIQ